MRRAFAACIAFAILVVVVAIRFGFEDAPHETPAIIDAAVADAQLDAAPVILDAAPAVKKPVPKPIAKRPTPKPKPAIPPPVVPPPVIPSGDRPRCTQAPNPPGCPATQPNINHPCDAAGVHCVYGTSCCPPVYVCNNGAFEAWFTSCP